MYHITKEERDRIQIIKSISIVMIVFLHSYTTEINFAQGHTALSLPKWLYLFETCISQIVARCGVPLFFLFSSVLLFHTDRKYRDVIRKKSQTLLLPYLVWNTFWIAVFILLQSLPFTAPYFSGDNTPILQCSVREWFGLYGIGQTYPQCYPLWFMRDLMVLTVIYPLIRGAVDRFPRILFAAAVVLVICPVDFGGKISILWFVIGAAIVKMNLHFSILDQLSVIKTGSCYLLCTASALFYDIRVIRSLSVLTGVIFWLRISRELYVHETIRKKFLWFSEWIFIIYVLHELTLSCVRKLCLRMLPVSPVCLLAEYLFIPLSVTAGCIAAGMIFKKFLPQLYQVTTGGR